MSILIDFIQRGFCVLFNISNVTPNSFTGLLYCGFPRIGIFTFHRVTQSLLYLLKIKIIQLRRVQPRHLSESLNIEDFLDHSRIGANRTQIAIILNNTKDRNHIRGENFHQKGGNRNILEETIIDENIEIQTGDKKLMTEKENMTGKL
jgi:hypothetical protein